MRYLFFLITAASLFFTCKELNNPYDINSDAGKIAQETTLPDTTGRGNATITAIFDTAQGRTLIIVTFDSTSDTLFDTLSRQTFVDTTHYIDSIHVSDTLIVQETSYDTIIFQDTVTLTRYDTLHMSRYDTTWITKYDTTHINKYDTTHISHFDTTHISQYDTTHVFAYDTTHVIKYDTTHVTKYDTLHIDSKPHLSFLGLLSTGGSWSITFDTISPKPCTLWTNDYRYGDCFPRGSNNPAECYTFPGELISLYFTVKFSCPSCDSLHYYLSMPLELSSFSSDTSDWSRTLPSPSPYLYERPDDFHAPPGVYYITFTAFCVSPYITPLADLRYLTIVVRQGPAPGGSPGTAQ
jgi:hypothetical protein